MAYPARMSDMMFERHQFLPDADAEPTVPPVTLLDGLVAWLATIGILILLAGGVVIGALVWLMNLAFSAPAPDEGVGE